MQKKSEGKVTISNGDLWLCLPMPFFLHLEEKVLRTLLREKASYFCLNDGES